MKQFSLIKGPLSHPPQTTLNEWKKRIIINYKSVVSYCKNSIILCLKKMEKVFNKSYCQHEKKNEKLKIWKKLMLTNFQKTFIFLPSTNSTDVLLSLNKYSLEKFTFMSEKSRIQIVVFKCLLRLKMYPPKQTNKIIT